MKLSGKVPKGLYFTSMGVIRSKSNVAADDMITNSKIRGFCPFLPTKSAAARTCSRDLVQSSNY